MRKSVAWALCAAMVLGLAACGGSAANGGGSGNAAEAGTGAGAETEASAIDKSLIARNGINVCIASEPDNIDPALNSTVDGATLMLQILHVLHSGLKTGNSIHFPAEHVQLTKYTL